MNVIPQPTVEQGRRRRIVIRWLVVDDAGRVRVDCRTEADAVEIAARLQGATP